MRDTAHAALDWLVGDCRLFGLTGQNWMPVVGGGLLLYIAGHCAAAANRHAVAIGALL